MIRRISASIGAIFLVNKITGKKESWEFPNQDFIAVATKIFLRHSIQT